MLTYRDVLDNDGLIARRRSGYERRAEQLAMAAEVDAAIRSKRSIAIEAGTGVGKSFAYLVPAILYAVEGQALDCRTDDYFPLPEDEEQTPPAPAPPSALPEDGELDREEDPFALRRVVISTNTISLQEQLFQKDVPFLNSILPLSFSVALAKGRANYLCQRRFASAKKAVGKGTLLEDDGGEEFERIQKWLETTTDGSKSELAPAPSVDVWNEICCEQGNCLGRKCKFYDSCFYRQARRRLEHANIIIVNHALLFSDLALKSSGGAILPNYDILIFDEAHTMENVASEQLGVEVTESSVDYLLSRLYNDRANKGLLVEETSRPWSEERELFVNAAKQVDECRYRAERFFNELREWLDARPGSNGRVFEPEIVGAGLTEGLEGLKNALRRAEETLEDADRRQEYRASRMRVSALIAELEDWRLQRSDGYVYWIESFVARKKRRVAMRAAPIDVAPILREKLFNATPSVIATSATLTVGGVKKCERAEEISLDAIALSPDDEPEETRRAFKFFRSRVGLTGAAARSLGSPFDYKRQMTLVLAKKLELSEFAAIRRGLSEEERREENERRLCAALREYVAETDGGVFVLFTNAAQMKRATATLSDFMVERNYPFYSQSEGVPRQLMVRKFKESSRSVLFGVDSFWQGVDVPGEALRNVIIVKLPFLAPEQPLVEAKLEAIRERGGNDFQEFLLPNAILKFKQGVGRLIRTREDVGQVVLLDERVHTKTYGRQFLEALPDCRLRVDVFN